MILWTNPALRASSEEAEEYYWATEPWVTNLLFSLVRTIGAKSVLEIGVDWGMTTIALAAALEDAAEGILHAVDIDDGSAPNSNIIRAQERIARAGLDHRVIWHLGKPSQVVVPQLEECWDFAFIDGDHSYAAVDADFKAVWPKMTPGGLVVFHDSGLESGYEAGRWVADNLSYCRRIQLNTVPHRFLGKSLGLTILQKEP